MISVIVDHCRAYPLSRKFLPGKKVFHRYVRFHHALFPEDFIPTYFVVRNVGLIDTRWAIILPNALSVWNLMVTLTYFRTSLSEELFEAAVLEGASDLRMLISIVLPLSQAIIAVIALYLCHRVMEFILRCL